LDDLPPFAEVDFFVVLLLDDLLLLVAVDFDFVLLLDDLLLFVAVVFDFVLLLEELPFWGVVFDFGLFFSVTLSDKSSPHFFRYFTGLVFYHISC